MRNVMTTCQCLTQMVDSSNEFKLLLGPSIGHIDGKVKVDMVFLFAAVSICLPKEAHKLYNQDFWKADNLCGFVVFDCVSATSTVEVDLFRDALLRQEVCQGAASVACWKR